MKTVNFIVFGAQRCGTSWLYSEIKKHPNIFLTDKKELHFFNKHYHQGIDEYHRKFTNKKDWQIAGDVTPDYMDKDYVPERIYKYNSDIKLVVILRNPVDRAFSCYKMFHKFFKGHDFESALQHYPGLVESGKYTKHLDNWYKYFRKEQILILFFDELNTAKEDVLRKIYIHLEVDHSIEFSSDKSYVVNAPIYPKLQLYLEKIHLAWIVDVVKKTPLNKIIRRRYLSRRETDKNAGGQLKDETKKRLTRIFMPYNQELSELTGFSLKHWNE